MVRPPAVAGQFYPGTARELAAAVGECLEPGAEPRPVLMVLAPHAGYVYSGKVAGKTFSRAALPRRVLVAGPNHRGLGAPVALMSRGSWLTPLGEVPLDAELGALLAGRSPLVREDAKAHQMEHSLEVQVPFLQTLRPDLLLTPLCLSFLRVEQCFALAADLAGAIRELGEPVLLVASSDLSHYETAGEAKAHDTAALAPLLALDPAGLYETVRRQGITMCGVIPATVLLAAAQALGARRAELVEYRNSGDASGDYRQVVGYAGVIVA